MRTSIQPSSEPTTDITAEMVCPQPKPQQQPPIITRVGQFIEFLGRHMLIHVQKQSRAKEPLTIAAPDGMVNAPAVKLPTGFSWISSFHGQQSNGLATRKASLKKDSTSKWIYSPPPPEKVVLVDTVEAIKDMLSNHLWYLRRNKADMVIDLEGKQLCRKGTIAIVIIHLPSTKYTFLVDITILGDKAFTTPNRSKIFDLRFLLESKTCKKVMWDCRNDSDALYAHYGIKLAGICDIQLYELVLRNDCKMFRAGLGSYLSEQSDEAKAAGKRLWAPELGGSYEVWDQRPLHPDLKNYCVANVEEQLALFERWNVDLKYSRWRRTAVEEATKACIEATWGSKYDGLSKWKAYRPAMSGFGCGRRCGKCYARSQGWFD